MIIWITLRGSDYEVPYSRNTVMFKTICLIKVKIRRSDVDDVRLAETSFATLKKNKREPRQSAIDELSILTAVQGVSEISKDSKQCFKGISQETSG